MNSAKVAGDNPWLWPALILVLALRLATLGAYPLTDTTEARYGEMARKMVELGDWITPWFDYGVPFWGKPPLAFWLSAGSARVLGLDEFALRLPSFLLGLSMLGLCALSLRHRPGDTAARAMLVLASSAVFFLCSGAVLTDTALAFSVTLAMVAFGFGVVVPDGAATRWRLLFFGALGLGLLAKGPIVLILVGLPIGAWSLASGRVREVLCTLPWVRGSLLCVLIALPWYLAAEQRTPGFLDYFLAGEHFARYTDPGWNGDRYGSIHDRPRGYIWLLWLGAALPWSLWLGVGGIRALRRHGTGALRQAAGHFRASPWRPYWLAFALTPPLFFSMAGSVLPTYVLPGIPALALLIADLSADHPGSATAHPRRWAASAVLLPACFAIAVGISGARFSADKSERDLLRHLPPGASLAYYPKRPFSAQFYSGGRAVEIRSADELVGWQQQNPQGHVVSPKAEGLPAALQDRYREVARLGDRKPRTLWAPRADRPAAAGR